MIENLSLKKIFRGIQVSHQLCFILNIWSNNCCIWSNIFNFFLRIFIVLKGMLKSKMIVFDWCSKDNITSLHIINKYFFACLCSKLHHFGFRGHMLVIIMSDVQDIIILFLGFINVVYLMYFLKFKGLTEL